MSTTLNKLLNGILRGHPVQFRAGSEKAVQEVDAALKHIPVPLSSKQQDAVRNALTSDLSYIQGPPGTGKSHTITAIMLAAVVMEKSVLLVSHKKAAIDVVRNKLHSILGDDFTIYVGDGTQDRAETKRRISELRQQIGAGYERRVEGLISTERDLATSLRTTLAQADRERSLLAQALERTHGSYQAQKDHLDCRKTYQAEYDATDLAAEVLAALPPEISPEWQRTVRGIDEVWSRRVKAENIPKGEMLRTRIGLAAYCRNLQANWLRIPGNRWEVHRLKDHYEAITAYDRARREEKLIHIDLNSVRRKISELEHKIEAQAREYLKAGFRRIQLQNAQTAADDLAHFEALFRLRRPSLVRRHLEQINYAAITRVFPLWLGEMRHLGAALALKPDVFDLAVVDEASQVNIPEIVPVFYRAKGFVVVGDQKQLGIEAAGLFGLNRTYEQLIWNNCLNGAQGTFGYTDAKERNLTVCDASILDFIMSPSVGLNIPKVTLDEHFRSMPTLADFTSEAFYQDDGKLKVMTEVSGNLGKQCFNFVEVGGTRPLDGSKYVLDEVEHALTFIREVISGRELAEGSALWKLGFTPDEPPTIGVISFLSDQRDLLRQKAEETIDEADRNKLELFIGTPEDFQGNERDVMVPDLRLG
jgi:urease beta subunit